MHQGKIFKNKLKAWKLKYNKSNDDFAYEINTNTVVLYRNFKTETLSTRLLLKLCDAFNCPITDFFDDKYKPKTLSHTNHTQNEKLNEVDLYQQKSSKLSSLHNNNETKEMLSSDVYLIISEKNKIIDQQQNLLEYMDRYFKIKD